MVSKFSLSWKAVVILVVIIVRVLTAIPTVWILIIHQLRDCHPYELMIIWTWSFQQLQFLLNTSAYNILLQHCISFFFVLLSLSTLPWTKEQELPGFFGSIVFSGLKDTGIASCIIWQGYSQKGPVADITWRIRFNRRLAGVRKRVPSADYKEGFFFFQNNTVAVYRCICMHMPHDPFLKYSRDFLSFNSIGCLGGEKGHNSPPSNSDSVETATA